MERFGLKKTLKTLKMLVLCLGWQRKLSVLLVKLKELGCGSGETKKEGEKAKKKGKKAKLFSCGHPEGKGNAKPDLQR